VLPAFVISPAPTAGIARRNPPQNPPLKIGQHFLVAVPRILNAAAKLRK
jgi:hypothetical protein